MLLAAALLSLGVLGASSRARGAPDRIVVLAPSATEIVYALGAGSLVVGVCAQCDYPPEARTVAPMGGYLTPSLEAVVAARPDLVVAVPSPANREAVRGIERLGVPVLVVQDRRLADLWSGIETIGRALGREEAAATLAGGIHEGLDAVAARVARCPRRRVLLVLGHRPLVVAGRDTLQHELVELAGGQNVAADVGPAFPLVSIELVAARAPEVILDAAMGTEAGGRETFAALAGVRTLAGVRVVSLPADELMRTGPRVATAARLLAERIHPEAFAAGGCR